MGEIMLKPDATFREVREIITEDLGFGGPMKLIHKKAEGKGFGPHGEDAIGHEADHVQVSEYFSMEMGEKLIVQEGGDWRGGSGGEIQPSYGRSLAGTTRASDYMGARTGHAAAPVAGGGDISVPVYWGEKGAANQRGEVLLDLERDTIGDVREKIRHVRLRRELSVTFVVFAHFSAE